MYRSTTVEWKTNLQRHSCTAQESCTLWRHGSGNQENGEVAESHEFKRLAGDCIRRYDVDDTTQYLRWKIKIRGNWWVSAIIKVEFLEHERWRGGVVLCSVSSPVAVFRPAIWIRCTEKACTNCWSVPS